MFDVDSVSTRLEEGEATVVDVGVQQVRNHIIDELHRYFLMRRLREELRIGILENLFNFDPDGENDHRHDEGNEDLLTDVFALEFGLDLRDRDEELLSVVRVQRQLVDVPEERPVDEVRYKADHPCRLVALDFLLDLENVLLCEIRLT